MKIKNYYWRNESDARHVNPLASWKCEVHYPSPWVHCAGVLVVKIPEDVNLNIISAEFRLLFCPPSPFEGWRREGWQRPCSRTCERRIKGRMQSQLKTRGPWSHGAMRIFPVSRLCDECIDIKKGHISAPSRSPGTGMLMPLRLRAEILPRPVGDVESTPPSWSWSCRMPEARGSTAFIPTSNSLFSPWDIQGGMSLPNMWLCTWAWMYESNRDTSAWGLSGDIIRKLPPLLDLLAIIFL